MVKLSELIERLQNYQEEFGDIPVFYGIDELPCWESKKSATVDDLPIRVDYRGDNNLKRWDMYPYLYMADYADVADLQHTIHQLEKALWKKRSMWQRFRTWVILR